MPRLAEMKDVFRHLCRAKNCRLHSQLDDGELLRRFLAEREELAFEELVVRHGPIVRAVCRRILGATADADDAFQATFLVLIRRARSIRRTDLLANWLCAVAYRTARQALRRRYRLSLRERPVEILPEQGRQDEPPRDWLPLFDAALQRLPSKYREPMVLCELQGLPRPEAARKLGLNEGTLSSRLGRARDLLRQRLGRHGFPLAIGSALAPTLVPEALTASTAASAITISSASISAIVLTEGVLAAMFASKLKAGAACATVLLFGTIAGLQFTGPTILAGGPPGKEGPAATDVPKVAAKSAPVVEKNELASKPSELAAEYKPFQGEWTATSIEFDGAGQSFHVVGVDEQWRFAGTVLTTGGEVKADGGAPFRLNPKSNPGTIDFSLAHFDGNGTGALDKAEYLGVYRFEADGRLLICFRPKIRDVIRPTRFGTAPKSGAILITLRRPESKETLPIAVDYAVPIVQNERNFSVKVPAPSPAKNADLAQVMGAWELADVDGMTPEVARQKLNRDRLPPGDAGSSALRRWELLCHLYLLPGSAPITLTPEARGSMCLANFELDGARSPKWITLRAMIQQPTDDPDNRNAFKDVRLSGIYKLDGEKLVMCLPEGEVSPLLRPTEFKGDGEGGLYVLTYVRSTKDWKQVMPPIAVPASNATVPVAPSGIPAQGPQALLPFDGNDPFVPPTGVPQQLVTPPIVNSVIPPVGLPVANTPSSPPVATTILDRLQGEWVMTKRNGQSIATATADEFMEVVNDRILLGKGHGRIQVDESVSPKRIIIDSREGPIHCIFRVHGDVWTMACYDKPGKLIPIDFEPDVANGISVIVYERAKGSRPSRNSDSGASGSIRELPIAPGTAPRDLQKEVDQLREQVKRLEKELKERPLSVPNAKD